MTKLGVTPGVHGDEEKTDSSIAEGVKHDSKVFTVLQPTMIPLPVAAPAVSNRHTTAAILLRGIILFLLFVSCFTAGLVLIYGVDTVYAGIFGTSSTEQSSVTTTVAPIEPLKLVNPVDNVTPSIPKDDKAADGEVKIFLNAIPVAKVMMIEGGSSSEAKDSQPKDVNERPLHPYEQQEAPFEAFNNRPMINVIPHIISLQARQMAYNQALRQWRLRRLHQAIFQQLMKMAIMRAEFAQMEYERRAALESEIARSIAQARWEQAQRARAAEEYQAQMQRAQWAQAQAQNWQSDRAQMAQYQQQQQQYWPNAWWQRQQTQQQYFNNPRAAQQWYYYPQQHGVYYQQQPQQQQQQQFPQPQPLQYQYYQFPIPMRPHDASPAQIISMQQPTVPPAPEMAIHDKIYQEMQKKSQGMDFNAPSKPIWTAITPTPETPSANYDHDSIFRENLQKINEQSATTTTVSPTSEKVAEMDGENMFRDILSVFDEAEKGETTPASTTENIFKEFGEEKLISTEIPTTEKETVDRVVDSAAQIPEGESEEIQLGPVVVEDSFPRIDDRTTIAIEASTALPRSESDEVLEHDPLAAFLRYFEQEAQKINSAKAAAPAIVDSQVQKDDPKDDQPAAVDEPEPHFQEFQHAPRLVTV
ncbi:unnamed protein product [Angiostrongylus costaricensis]|uniref:Prion-like-(Q/N-rich) domain-bearing protein 25 n=1 Tax=Angiostrongylus costaricensis TaxID=334426 RepID=A0A0R3PR29_ANGCS|nr:unnamed protein product [Angiostrongylus costaricensis]